MGSTISQSESNVASFFADDDHDDDNDASGPHSNTFNISSRNNKNTNTNHRRNQEGEERTVTNSKTTTTTSRLNHSHPHHYNSHHYNIFCVGCSDGGKTSFHNQLKAKFQMKIHKNEKTRLTLILKTCISSISDIIYSVMSDQERNDFIVKVKKLDPQIYDFLLNLTNITRKWEFSKSESIQYGQYIRMIWSKYKIIPELYHQCRDSHHLNDNIDTLCNEMNIIISEISDHQRNQFLKNTKKRLNQRLNYSKQIVRSDSDMCDQLDEMNSNSLYDDEDLDQLDNHIDTIMNQKRNRSIFAISKYSNCTHINNTKNGNDKYSPMIRFLTIGKSESNFQFDSKNNFTILDLGGRGAEKKKWEFFLNETNADFVLFFVSMSEFNQNLIENDQLNRLNESLTIYRDVINRALLRNTKDIILIFTKPDLFKAKIENNIEFILPNMENMKLKVERWTRPEFGKLNENIKYQVNDLINLFENVHLDSFNNFLRPFKYHIVNTINVKECEEFIDILLRQTIVKDYIENSLQKKTSITYTPFISKCLYKETSCFIHRICEFSDCSIYFETRSNIEKHF